MSNNHLESNDVKRTSFIFVAFLFFVFLRLIQEVKVEAVVGVLGHIISCYCS